MWLLLAGLAAAEPAQYEGRLITRVQFEPRSQPLAAEDLASLIPFRPGQSLHLREVREAIQKMYATGRYQDIAVRAESQDGGVTVIFVTESAYFVGNVSIVGLAPPPNEGQARVATKLKLGARYSQDLVQQAVDGLETVLRDNGFYRFQIQQRAQPQPETYEVNFEFDINPGERADLSRPEIRGEDLATTDDELVDATHWKGWLGWKRATDERLQSGIDRIRKWYRKRDYLMAEVTLESTVYNEKENQVHAVIRVTAGPIIRLVANGAKIGRSTLQRLVPVFEEQSVDRDLLEEGKRNLEAYFQSRGHFHARVDFSREDVSPNEQVIAYNIDLGPRVKLVSVEIGGNEYFEDASIRERLSVIPSSFQYPRGKLDQSRISSDVAAIEYLYHSNGFRDVKVTSQVIPDIDGKEDDYGVRYQITEGVQYFVGDLKLEGIRQQDEEQIRYLLSSISGQPFSQLSVAIDRDAILAYYFERGFPDAVFEWTAEPAPGEENLVDLKFVLTRGDQKVVRQVLVQGLEETQTKVVDRQITLHPGDPLSLSRMVDIQRRLYGLGIFAKVDMAVQNPDGNETRKFVQYDLEEAKKFSVTGGLGAEFGRLGGATGQSPAGAPTFAPRVQLNLTRVNFRGRANTLSLKSRFSQIQQRGLVTWLAPGFRGRQKLTLSFAGLVDESRDIRTFTARRYEGSLQLVQNISRIYTALYRFSYRLVKIGNLQIAPELIPVASQAVRIGLLSGTLIQDRRDDPTNAKRGYYNTIDFGIASKAFASESGFIRTVGRNSTYHQIAPRLVFARSTSFGWQPAFRQTLVGGELIPDIPLAERFFSGGASSHRGFPENQAGPRDPQTGFPIGGTAELFNSLEVRFPLLGDNLGAVLFHDAGNVYTQLSDISFRVHQRDPTDFAYMVHAVGLGIRYNTPIGPIRLDVAYGLNSPRFYVSPADSSQGCVNPSAGCPIDSIRRFQFHFSLGQAF